ncbi:Sulfatase [Nitrosopumilaceae archaeon]|nr:sulfatase-like hydrolase/transferase [Nitrosopumilus sp.]MDA7997034.1 sulfatase-like hydrolase/transferase [Nitrosopumilus sp.]CAI9832563.1 Sulfatase [Nitrosopumilaceae archaeon]
MGGRNVIILMIDGGRLDRALGSEAFGRLAGRSAFFSQPITYGPHTIAAMHAVFSGSYGCRTGTDSYWSTYKFKKGMFKTLPEYLHDLGYYTAADVVNELVIPRQGLDEFLIHDESKDDLVARHAGMLEEMKGRSDSGGSFFLYLQYSNIHTGIMNEVLRVYDNFSEEYFADRDGNRRRYDRLFAGAERYLDAMLGKIGELGLDRDSLILVMSDHGISTGEKVGERAYGAFCYDYTLRTFAYFMWPGISPVRVDRQVRTVDFMPTILDYLGIPASGDHEPMDGVSLMPLTRGEKAGELGAFSETGNPLSGTRPPERPNTRSLRRSGWKLILNEHDGTRELYDLASDPGEERNLAGTGLSEEDSLLEEIQRYVR